MDEEQLRKIRQIFLEAAAEFPQIRLAYLFGSMVSGRVGPLSDLDVAVLADRGAANPDLRSRLGVYLAERMEARIDLILLNRAPVELAYAVISTGEVVYERNAAARVDYEARVMGLYFDYLPVLRDQRRDILEGETYAARVHRYREALGRTLGSLGKIGALSK